MIRELVLDTETTGLSPENGDKIVEIGIVELINHIPTTNFFHQYINPERPVPDAAVKIHGLNYEFLKTKPVFEEISNEMLEFINYDNIIIHNATFDLSFLNMELKSINRSPINKSKIIDTLTLAREKFPGSPASLDALCRRFSIDNSHRDLHGALLDSYSLAKVYLELIGGNQPNLNLSNSQPAKKGFEQVSVKTKSMKFQRKNKLPKRVTEIEASKHKEFIKKINGLHKWSIYDKITH